MSKQIDVIGYLATSLPRMTTNISRKERLPTYKVHGIPKINWKIKQRRLQLAGHCIRYTDELVQKLILWKPKNGIPYNICIRNRGRQPITSIYIIKNCGSVKKTNYEH